MKIKLLLLFACFTINMSMQAQKTELYDLVKKLLPDSTGFENVGDWAVGELKQHAIAWKTDNIEMSDDTSINFYRRGTADITIKGKSIVGVNKDAKWNIMLKGPRMGYTSFSMISASSRDLHSMLNIDSVFGSKTYKAKLIKSCDTKPILGYYYYELKMPKKDIAYIKVSWLTVNGSTALRIDGYDNRSKNSAKFDCR